MRKYYFTNDVAAARYDNLELSFYLIHVNIN